MRQITITKNLNFDLCYILINIITILLISKFYYSRNIYKFSCIQTLLYESVILHQKINFKRKKGVVVYTMNFAVSKPSFISCLDWPPKPLFSDLNLICFFLAPRSENIKIYLRNHLRFVSEIFRKDVEDSGKSI